MAENEGEKAAQLIAGPLGGFAIAAFFLPVGCTEIVPLGARCPAGQATNLFGWTVGGYVGALDGPALFGLGLVLAVAGYLLVSWLTQRR